MAFARYAPAKGQLQLPLSCRWKSRRSRFAGIVYFIQGMVYSALAVTGLLLLFLAWDIANNGNRWSLKPGGPSILSCNRSDITRTMLTNKISMLYAAVNNHYQSWLIGRVGKQGIVCLRRWKVKVCGSDIGFFFWGAFWLDVNDFRIMRRWIDEWSVDSLVPSTTQIAWNLERLTARNGFDQFIGNRSAGSNRLMLSEVSKHHLYLHLAFPALLSEKVFTAVIFTEPSYISPDSNKVTPQVASGNIGSTRGSRALGFLWTPNCDENE